MKTNPSSITDKPQAATHRPLGSCLLALFLALVWSGCKPETKVAVSPAPAQNYTLISIDGKPVPGTLTHEGATLTVKSGVFILNGDGTCSCKTSFSIPPNGDVNREVKATYTQEGAKLTMKWEGAGITKGSLEGNTFTMDNEGMVFVYQR